MNHSSPQDELREQAALYALGALTQLEARAFKEHLEEDCAVCRDEVLAFESVVADLGFAAADEAPSAGVRARLAERLVEEQRAEGPSTKPRQAPLLQPITVRANEGEWREIADGVFEKVLFKSEKSGTITSLYKMMAGAKCASHRHLGVEECLVLEGDFHANGQVFGQGDYRSMMPGSVDEDLYTIGGALLLIIAPENPYELVMPT